MLRHAVRAHRKLRQAGCDELSHAPIGIVRVAPANAPIEGVWAGGGGWVAP